MSRQGLLCLCCCFQRRILSLLFRSGSLKRLCIWLCQRLFPHTSSFLFISLLAFGLHSLIRAHLAQLFSSSGQVQSTSQSRRPSSARTSQQKRISNKSFIR